MPLFSACLELHNYSHFLSGSGSSPDTSIPRPMSIFLTDGSGGITHYTTHEEPVYTDLSFSAALFLSIQ